MLNLRLKVMQGLENLMNALKDEGGRKKAFKLEEITLSNQQKEKLKESKTGYNKLALTDIKAYKITRSKKQVVDCVKVVWTLFKKYGMMHYYTTKEFNDIIENN